MKPPLPCPSIHLNGSLVPAEQASVSVLDHGLLYGDGLFETVRVANATCFRAPRHLDRLVESAARLELSVPASPERLLQALSETAAANRLREGLLRLTLTRGTGSPVPDPRVCPEPTWFITARPAPVPDEAAFARGVRLCVGPPHPRLLVPGIKSLCFLPYQLARTAARARGADDALLTHDGQAVETGISNLFAVLDGTLITPPVDSGCLPGIVRALVLEQAAQLGISAREAPLPVEQLPRAKELLITNSGAGVLPVLALEDQPVGSGFAGPIATALRGAYRETLRRECGWTGG